MRTLGIPAAIRKAVLGLYPLLVLEVLAGCGSSSSSPPPPPSNPVPTAISLAPAKAIAGDSAFTLAVNGNGFVQGSTVQWNGSNRTTAYYSVTQLTAAIPAADIATIGTANITVVNPAPGGGTSQTLSFAINNAVPAITSISPSSAAVGSPGFTLKVIGSGFIAASKIFWNGNSHTTTFVSATQLTTSINASDVAAGQNAVVSVVNPSPGGGPSTEAVFAVNNPEPSFAFISPSTAAAGSAGFTLTVSGSDFLPGSTVEWNGSVGQPPIATTWINANEVTVAIPTADIAFAGDANVTVVNPAPGGGTSASATFIITGGIPSNVSFVAPNGSDTNPGTIADPYLTIQKCASTVSSGYICAIRAGTYRETVTPNSGITITSYNGEPVTVDGSDPATGWTAYKGSIYKASVALLSGDANQVFVGNQMMTEARWPNGDDLFHVNWATLASGTTDTEAVDPNLPNIDWTGAKIHLWSGTDPWDPLTGTVTASSMGQLTFTLDGAGYAGSIETMPGGYYYLYRLLGGLDAPNEWFYDSAAGVLYFWAPGGVNPASLNVTAKQRQFGFDLSGDSNVTVQYINLFATAINTDSSSTNNTINGINAKYLSQFTDLVDLPGWPDSDEVEYSSTSGIVLDGYGNTLENSAIAYSAGNGVSILGSNNTITNNLVHHIDYAANYCSGINFSGGVGSNNEVSYNTVYASARFNIGLMSATSEDISYNNLYDAMMVSRDGGEIYASFDPQFQGSAGGTQIHHNWFHDTQSLISGPADDYPLSGTYLDEDTNGLNIYQNVFWNNQFSSVLLNFSNDGITAPNDNVVENNTVPDVNSTSYIWANLNTPCGTTEVNNNLVLVPVFQSGTTVCPASNNGPTAPGATQMHSSVQVGCNFAGCSSEGPPAISGSSVTASIAVQPYNIEVAAGQPATFTVTGAGSQTLTYQWQRNGSEITGATNASYTLSATTAADNGAVFTVTVSNAIGSITSSSAVLTVQ